MSEVPVIGTATAQAHPNIALVKYWGKRNRALNIPATGSLSMTMAAFTTRTTVTFLEEPGEDEVELNGQPADSGTTLRVSRFLDLVRGEAGIHRAARVVSSNQLLTSAGLASSASAFAALALATCKAAGLDPSAHDLALLARQGSASAARSIYGGFVEMRPGSRADGLDTVVSTLAPPDHWDLRILVIITQETPKEVSSTEGMVHTAETSPYYPAWLETHESDLAAARQAVLDRDLETLGRVTEHNTLKMHGAAMAARPGLLYWNGATVEVMHALMQLRRGGLQAYFTIDAGPQVLVLCLPEAEARLTQVLGAVPGVRRLLGTSPGLGATLVP